MAQPMFGWVLLVVAAVAPGPLPDRAAVRYRRDEDVSLEMFFGKNYG